MLHSSSFGVAPVDDIASLHAMLYADDLVGWTRRNLRKSAPLNEWIGENIVHAMESCPKVLRHWQQSQAGPMVKHIQYRYVAAALEGLDDSIKMGILLGHGQGEAQMGLYQFIQTTPTPWAVLSPSWAGEPGSDLRNIMLQLGWTPVRFLSQVAHSIGRPAAARWSTWVPYPHSLAVFARGSRVMQEKKFPSVNGLAAIERTGQPWASPEDMALAMALARGFSDYRYTLTPHPKAASVSVELQERMDALVAVHMAMGGMLVLQKKVVMGDNLERTVERDMDLPNLVF